MLRKLFIGLLILSALTSKGAGSEISDASERFSPESLLSLCGDERLTEAGSVRVTALLKDARASVGSALAPLGDFLRVKSLEQHIYCSIEDSSAYKCLEYCLFGAERISNTYSRNIVASGTDISPPSYKINTFISKEL